MRRDSRRSIGLSGMNLPLGHNLSRRHDSRRRNMKHSFSIFFLCVLLSPAGEAAAQDKQTACRSVHLWYKAPEAAAFYNEVTVERSAPGTYFCVCGWDRGYFGIQELGNGKKVIIFSVWDSNQNDRNAVEEEKRVKLLYRDEKVRIGRFGGEGTGGQSFLDYEWKIGQTYRLMVSAKADGERTEYGGWFYVPEEKGWKHLVTFSTITRSKKLRGYYSFIEDFRRDGVSATRARSALYGNTWVKVGEEWEMAASARFTGDRNPAMNIDAAVREERFWLATGGETKNVETKLGESMTLSSNEKRKAPGDLPEVR